MFYSCRPILGFLAASILPLVAGAAVEGEIVQQGRGPKLIVFKFRKRKRSRRKAGHRQSFTAVKITGVKG